mgnify:CR=1 FL=1
MATGNESSELEQTLCPKYNYCKTGRVLSERFCTQYKCNTYYDINTIKLYYRIIGEMGKEGNGNEKSEESDIGRIIKAKNEA